MPTGTTVAQSLNPSIGGSDLIEIGPGYNVVIGGAAGDRVSVEGSNLNDQAVVLGDNGQLTLDNAGVLLSLTSSDFESGDSDIITLSSGTNSVIGGVGADEITAGGGVNTVLGDDGEAYFSDNGEISSIRSVNSGNGGEDVIRLDNGINTVIAGAESDEIAIGAGENTVLGDEGSLVVNPVDGSVTIQTENPEVVGDDDVQASDGFNIVLGGSGADRVFADPQGNEPELQVIALGDNGRVLLDVLNQPVNIVSIGSVFGGIDTITTGPGQDYILGGDLGDVIQAFAGKDLILGDHGELIWNETADPPFLSEISTTAPLYAGDDSIDGGDNTDVIFGGGGGDTIHGGADNSSDIAIGDNGYARFNAEGRMIEFGTSDHEYGGADMITTADGRDYVVGGDDGDVLATNGGHDVVLGDTGRMTWSESNDPPMLFEIISPSEDTAHGGNDTIYAGEGNDLAFGGIGSDVVFGGTGDDVLSNYQAKVTIPLPTPETVSRWGDQGIRYLWDQEMSLVGSENFTPLTSGGDSSTGTGLPVVSDNRLYGEDGDDFYLMVPGGSDIIDEGVVASSISNNDEILGSEPDDLLGSGQGSATGYDTVSFQTSERGITFDPDRLGEAQYVVDPVRVNIDEDTPATVLLTRTDALPARSVYENVIGTAYKDVVYTDTLPVVRTFKGGNPTTGASETAHGDELRVRTYG
ncbi:hypothetical protein N9B17_07985, partial [Rhodopirellula sp.]|nr:hypothetical protein [Rhodopirellula sp.]